MKTRERKEEKGRERREGTRERKESVSVEVAGLRREIPRAPQGWNPGQHEDTLTWGVNPYCEILSAPLQVSGLHNNLGTGKERMSCMKLTVHSEPSRCINDTSDVLVAGRVTGSGHPSWTG